ncbi:hypothetical protein [Trichocoleus sp. DQ-U1]|uniref:hypothetical protein n=1 Tax=Trichocoleus sp. DQ-U1 TaxID=2933926 RepID=UPI00329A7A38
MSYEDLVTMKAFLMALENLEQPLPQDLQTDLYMIAAGLPESAYELHELAERYAPLNQEYLSILRDLPGEGERLKFTSAEVRPENGDQSDYQTNEIEILIQQLQHQITQTSAQLHADRPMNDVSEGTASEHRYVSIGTLSEAPEVQPTKNPSSVRHLIQELGWTREQAAAIRYRLAAFREDWEAPGMEIYDDL